MAQEKARAKPVMGAHILGCRRSRSKAAEDGAKEWERRRGSDLCAEGAVVALMVLDGLQQVLRAPDCWSRWALRDSATQQASFAAQMPARPAMASMLRDHHIPVQRAWSFGLRVRGRRTRKSSRYTPLRHTELDARAPPSLQ